MESKLYKKGKTDAIFVGSQAAVQKVFDTLHFSFYFIAGNALPVVVDFPYYIELA